MWADRYFEWGRLACKAIKPLEPRQWDNKTPKIENLIIRKKRGLSKDFFSSRIVSLSGTFCLFLKLVQSAPPFFNFQKGLLPFFFLVLLFYSGLDGTNWEILLWPVRMVIGFNSRKERGDWLWSVPCRSSRSYGCHSGTSS